MYILFLLIHVVVCIFLIIVVLLQSGKAADLAGAFGGMGSQTAFGPRGSATLLSKATTISAVLFMITSLSLSILATRNAGLATTVLEATPAGSAPVKGAPAPAPIQIPVQPTNVNPAGGKTMPLPVPIPANQQSVPAPAPPTPAKK
jgi:preprotein translocase subunit SecG